METECPYCGMRFAGDDAEVRRQAHEPVCPRHPSDGPSLTDPARESPTATAAHIRAIFFNERELRAGWRFLIYVVLAVGCVVGLTLGAAWILGARRGGFNPLVTQTLEFTSFLGVLLPALVLGKFERRSLGDYGLPATKAFGRRFGEGLLFGLAAVTLLMLMMRGAHAFYFGHLGMHGARILKWAAFWGLFFLWVGLFEEFAFRGYALLTLASGMGFWPAAVLLSILFGAVHLGNPGEAWVGALSAGLIGMFLAFTFRRTGSLWWAVGFHQAFDWGETFLYSVPNSGLRTPGHLLNSHFQGPRWLTGGTVGPEGSVLVFLLILLLFVVFDRMYRTVRFPCSEAGATSPPALVENPSLLR